MKIRHILKIVAVIILILNFTAGGLVGFQYQDTVKGIGLEQLIPSGEIQNGLHLDSQPVRAESIFSTATLLSLILAVLGIVAFRRNSYN